MVFKEIVNQILVTEFALLVTIQVHIRNREKHNHLKVG